VRWFAAALFSAALACGDSAEPDTTAGPVRIQPAAHSYQQGSTVGLTITNLSAERLEYSACLYHIERRAQSGVWHLVYQEQSPCAASLEYLEPSASRSASVTLPDELASDPHRARFPWIGVRLGDEEPFIPAAQIGDSFEVQP
jgi:hypothetical protein